MKSTNAASIEKVKISEIISGVPHGIAILDRDLCVVEMNRSLELLTGITASEARGIRADFILRCNIGKSSKKFREVLETGNSLSVTGDIITQHHQKSPIHFTVSSLRDDSGKAAGLCIFLEDISVLQSADGKESNLDGVKDILGRSPKMLEMFELMPVLAHTDASILITGETGTGKDMIAEAIHKASSRTRHPFIKINCGALPEALLESELFGHVRGAFTGAVKDKPGLFSLARNGTIFLTEIGDLPLSLQVKLLSVLDDKEFFPVGGVKKEKVDVRIIAATHRPLRELVRRGEFREDLFYRLNVLRLHLPALRERDGDIRLLLDHFLRKLNTDLGKSIKGYTSKAIEILTSYHYPGNVRELRNIVEYAVHICQGKSVKKECLPEYVFSPQEDSRTVGEEEREQPGAGQTQSPGSSGGGWSDIEKEMILDALKETGGNRSKAAKILGWGRTTLWRKLNRYSLN